MKKVCYQTEEESFWAGQFGADYIERNPLHKNLPVNLALFSKVLQKTPNISSALELGANIGNNLSALHCLNPSLQLTGLEINETAFNALNQLGFVSAIHESILDFNPSRRWDLVLLKGVLIHLAPEKLGQVYQRIYQASRQYICIAEYYNPTPVEVNYRGHQGRLYKRDFAGEMLDKYSDLRLLDYGFVYHRDPVFPMDDINWFILEKQ